MPKKMIILLCAILIIVFGSYPKIIPTARAEIITPREEQLSYKVEAVTNVNQEKVVVEDNLVQLNEQMKRMDEALQDNHNYLLKTEQQIETVAIELSQLEKEAGALKDQISKRNEILKDRAQSYQESGGKVGYIEVFLGSLSFKDFIERVGVVTKIVNADRNLMEQHEADKKSLETKQSIIEKKLTDLTSLQTEFQGMQAQLIEQQQQTEQAKEQLEKKHTSIQIELAEAVAALQVVEGENPLISTVITAGYKYIGNSVYVFGGGRNEKDIENGRFDCSAFVHWAFSQGGIIIGSTTDTLKNSGTQIAVSEMKPGDLVFFDTYKQDGHVGIYLGDGKFIGSQSSTGVAIADMITGYWNETFNGRVVRMIIE